MSTRLARACLRLLAVLVLAVAVVALHTLDVGRTAPASVAAADVQEGAAHAGPHAPHEVPGTPQHQPAHDEPPGSSHHGLIGVCLAVLGSGVVLAAVVLLVRGRGRGQDLAAPRPRWRLGRVLARSLPPPRPSLHTLCVMRC
jgi:hypothetical protein